MRIARLVILAFLLLATSSLVWANGVPDPQMMVDPPPFCGPPTLVSSPFDFAASGGTGTYCFQRSDAGLPWLTLDVNLGGLSLTFTPSQISCPTDDLYFATPCQKVTDGSGNVTDLLFVADGVVHPGIGTGALFIIDINPPAGTCTLTDTSGTFCWGTGNFHATGLTTVVPEPASAVLLISGVGAMLGKRRWLRRS
ncbi:MAG TPA: PEP-CTERM sorting domain-containing protein [Terriglobales bacterium]|jgi:hypothetical protein|nr:PEP-CTERM sorting domain-containing protein [Terriglobales bacterium]